MAARPLVRADWKASQNFCFFSLLRHLILLCSRVDSRHSQCEHWPNPPLSTLRVCLRPCPFCVQPAGTTTVVVGTYCDDTPGASHPTPSAIITHTRTTNNNNNNKRETHDSSSFFFFTYPSLRKRSTRASHCLIGCCWCQRTGDTKYGRYIGELARDVSGQVYAVSDEVLFIKGFVYGGTGPGTFWIFI